MLLELREEVLDGVVIIQMEIEACGGFSAGEGGEMTAVAPIVAIWSRHSPS